MNIMKIVNRLAGGGGGGGGGGASPAACGDRCRGRGCKLDEEMREKRDRSPFWFWRSVSTSENGKS